jgi:hypothetical protein
MIINNLNKYNKSDIIFEKDINNREIRCYNFNNILLTGKSLYYPNILLYDKNNNLLYNPIEENVMSLKKITKDIKYNFNELKYEKINKDINFFFIYNTDNYFHFIYDTLPYLITYKELKLKIPNIKLLMNYPNDNKSSFYQFVIDTLLLLDITQNDINIIDDNILYENIYISTSYTHDIDSNLPPRTEIYGLYKKLAEKVNIKFKNKITPKNIYISRRSWIHGDFSNIGTNYTTRRKLINEDELVNLLINNDYIEVFPETMSMEEKIYLFYNAENIVGAFGGGICNVLFSKDNCNLIAIASPKFLDVNERFKYSLNQVNLNIFDDTKHVENSEFKMFMRVKYNNIIGEITAINNNKITISYIDTPISGWNNDIEYKTIVVNNTECIKLDDGLNSPWKIDLNKFKKLIK